MIDHTRRAARLMSASDRRIVILTLHRRLAAAPDTTFDALLEALLFDLLAAEDEERHLVNDIDT